MMASYTGKVQLSGAQNYELILDVTSSTNNSTNQSTLSWTLRVNDVNNWGSFGNYSTNWSSNVGAARSGSIGSFPAGDFTIASGSNTVSHNADGTKSLTVSGTWDSKHSNIGSGTVSYSITLPTVPRAPGVPTAVTLNTPTASTLKLNWTAPASVGGSAISAYEYQVWYDASFPSGTPLLSVAGTLRTATATGLDPKRIYHGRVRAKNAQGVSAWSSVPVNETSPAGPPTIVPTSSASGLSTHVVLTPPAGAVAPDQYRVVREEVPRVTSNPSTLMFETTLASFDVPADVPGTAWEALPGANYAWSAQGIWFQTGTSYQWTGPFSTPLNVVQKKPNTNPGDYFDGSTDDTGSDVDYKWGATGTGVAHADISIAVGQLVDGWEANPGTGAAVMYRVTAGLYGDYAARVVITRDTTSAGARFGQANVTGKQSEVAFDANYVGSIYVKLSRGNSVAAEITWLTAAGVLISRTVGTPTNVPSGAWYRLVVGGTAPSTAALAVVRVIDVAGTGWSLWQGGDIIDLDAAMITFNALEDYFDGSFTPTTDYLYDWTGVDDASTSTRTPLALASPASFGDDSVVLADPLLAPGVYTIVDPACVPPRPPRPPAVPNACITETGIWRRITAVIPPSLIADYLDVVPTFQVITKTSALSQLRIRIYENPLDLPPAQVDTTTWISEQIISYIPKATIMTVDGVLQRTYASVNGSQQVTADHLLYGSNGGPPVWPVLGCGIGYLVTADLPTNVPKGDSELLAAVTVRY
jgi:hypothetical protein